MFSHSHSIDQMEKGKLYHKIIHICLEMKMEIKNC